MTYSFKWFKHMGGYLYFCETMPNISKKQIEDNNKYHSTDS
jgi:hypothetical protein